MGHFIIFLCTKELLEINYNFAKQNSKSAYRVLRISNNKIKNNKV